MKICAFIIGLLPFVTEAQAAKAQPFKLEGAYYREEKGKLVASCQSNSAPAQTQSGYLEKFAFRAGPEGKISVQHWDGVCSDMLFMPEDVSQDELLKHFSFSERGLQMRSPKAIVPNALFRWRATDP